jgi:hypothetical protein
VNHEVQPAEPAVSDKPKRRWFQFSLKTLLFAITVIGLLLGAGGRAFYLTQRAEFHDGEYKRCIDSILAIYHEKHGDQAVDQKSFDELMGAEGTTRIRQLVTQSQRHKVIADDCRRAVWRPWVFVDDTLQDAP